MHAAIKAVFSALLQLVTIQNIEIHEDISVAKPPCSVLPITHVLLYIYLMSTLNSMHQLLHVINNHSECQISRTPSSDLLSLWTLIILLLERILLL